MWLLLPILFYSMIYLYIRHVYSHWERKGFPTERTGISWRFLKQVYKREFHSVDALCEAYRDGRQPLIGIYFFFRPTLLIRDVVLARVILENYQGHFNDTKWDYVQGYRRINLLERLAPIFSTGRMEGMFRNVEKVADNMLHHLNVQRDDRETVGVDLQKVLRIYSLNVISNLVYGLDQNIFEKDDPIFSNFLNNSLRHYSLNSFTLNHLSKKSATTYRLRDIMRESVERREEGSCIRKDILQLLVKFRNGNDISTAAKPHWYIDNVFEREKVLSISKLSKIAESFLNMGLQSVASVIVFTLYEILQDPYVLDKVWADLRQMKTANDQNDEDVNQLTFNDFANLKYLDMCIQETLRKYPGVPVIERVCRKNFNIPNSRFTIREGKTVMIPLLAIQRDEKYFADPQQYKPERFLNSEHVAKYKEAFMSFGMGGRTCVAQNFSNLVIKMALVKLLMQFNMELAMESKQVELTYNPNPFIKSRDGLKVRLKTQEIKPHFYL